MRKTRNCMETMPKGQCAFNFEFSQLPLSVIAEYEHGKNALFFNIT